MEKAALTRSARRLDVVGHADGERHHDARSRPPGRLGRRRDGRRNVVADGGRAGHPGDGAVGHAARQLEHGVAQRGDEDRRRLDIGDVERGEGVGGHTLPLEVHRLAPQQRHERGQVLPHVGRRALIAHAPHALDHHLVREADAQQEPVVRRHLHGEGLLGQHHRVPRVHRHHPGSQADAGHLRAGHGQERQRVGAEDLRREGMVEPGLPVPLQQGHHIGQRLVGLNHAPDAQWLWPCPWCSSRSLPVMSAPLSRRIPGRGRAG